MNLKGEFFLAWRYLKPQKSLVTMLTYLSLIGPILGVGVLLGVMAVMNGMPKAFVDQVLMWTPHISIEKSQGIIDNADALVEHIEQKYKVKAAPVTNLHVFLQKKKGVKGFLVKGVYPPKDKDVSRLKDMIDKEFMPEYKMNPGEIIISKSVAIELGYRQGDKVILHSPEKYKVMLDQQAEGMKRALPNTAQEFIIAGYFDFQIAELSKNVIFMHQDSANELMVMNWGDALQIEVALEDPEQAEAVANEMRVDPKLGGMYFTPWYKKNAFVERIRREKALLTFVLCFIMGGAAIGVAACLFSLVIQKTKEIGILKATGASPLSIIVVFLSQGTFIGVLGSVLGLLGGRVALKYREVIAETLGAWDAELYKLKSIPMHIDANDVNLIFWGSIIICVTAALVPAIVAACVNPVKALQSGS